MHRFFILLLLPSALMANEVDRIQTKEDVRQFMIRHFDTSFRSEAIDGFYKLDLDHNGSTDLVVSAGRFYVMMDMGGDEYEPHQLITGDSFNDGSIFSIDSSDRALRLVLKYKDFQNTILDTVVWFGRDFMEYNRRPDSAIDFDELHFTAYGCYGECPQYELTIMRDGSMVYMPKAYTGKKKDVRVRATAGEMNTLRSILGYMGLDRMDSVYSPFTQDAPGYLLEISYRGRSKKIEDKDGPSTNSLAALYRELFWFRYQLESN
jgi:hypothetical protein